MKGSRPLKKAFQGSETETRELLGGTKDKDILPDEDLLIFLNENQTGKIELVTRPDLLQSPASALPPLGSPHEGSTTPTAGSRHELQAEPDHPADNHHPVWSPGSFAEHLEDYVPMNPDIDRPSPPSNGSTLERTGTLFQVCMS